MNQKNNINIIYAGGTFGSYGMPLIPLEADVFLPVLLSQIQQHRDSIFRLHAVKKRELGIQLVDNVLIKDSSQLTTSDFFYFYQLILTYYAQGETNFVLITGTDTLSYLGAFLAECFAGSDICIVLTASMKPLLDTEVIDNFQIDVSSDAWDNLTLAIQTTQDKGFGVYTCLQGQAWHASSVQKMHSQQMQAFTGDLVSYYPASSYQSLSESNLNAWMVNRKQQLDTMKSRLHDLNVVTLFATPNHDDYLPSILSNILQELKRPTGILLLSFGSGNLPFTKALAEVFDRANQEGHIVVNTTQCPLGGVNTDYEAGSWQYQHHVLSADYLTTEATFARLLWLHLAYDNTSIRRQQWIQMMNDEKGELL